MRMKDDHMRNAQLKLNNELLLLCFGNNLNKLHAKIQSDRCGVTLYKKAIA